MPIFSPLPPLRFQALMPLIIRAFRFRRHLPPDAFFIIFAALRRRFFASCHASYAFSRAAADAAAAMAF